MVDENFLFKLISLGLGNIDNNLYVDNKVIDYGSIYSVANQQGVAAICLDGLQHIDGGEAASIDNTIKLQWIATTMRQEQFYNIQWQTAKSLATLYTKNGITTYVLKGFSLSRLYPKPEHRFFTDMDCYLKDSYEEGNRIANENGLTVDCSYYKHSKIFLKGLTVENHQYLLPIKGSVKAKIFERQLRDLIGDEKNEYIEDSQLKTTSPFFDAVYVLAHAQEHFLNEGIILRHICDWAMILKTYKNKVDWNEWKRICEEYGMLSFGYVMSRLANKVCGVVIPFSYPKDDVADRRLLDDTLYRITPINKKRSDIQLRIDLVKNMFLKSWKYRMFSDTNFLFFFGRRLRGYLFDKDLD